MKNTNTKHYTPHEWARLLFDKAYKPHRHYMPRKGPLSIIDPAVGDGALLEAVRGLWPDQYCLTGWDIEHSVRADELLGKHPDRDVYEACVDSLMDDPDEGERGLYDMLLMNPPFLGKSKFASQLGPDYLKRLKARFPAGKEYQRPGDLSAWFLRLAHGICAERATIGAIMPNTIAQGDTRRVGLKFMVAHGWTIYGCANDLPWPGKAAVTCSIVWLCRGFDPSDYEVEMFHEADYEIYPHSEL